MSAKKGSTFQKKVRAAQLKQKKCLRCDRLFRTNLYFNYRICQSCKQTTFQRSNTIWLSDDLRKVFDEDFGIFGKIKGSL